MADRGPDGRFVKGNKAAKGNKTFCRMAQLRRLLLESVSDEDFVAIVRSVVKQAREGDLAACRLMLEYLVGRPPSSDHWRLDELEERLSTLLRTNGYASAN